jgi:hypothetical protein
VCLEASEFPPHAPLFLPAATDAIPSSSAAPCTYPDKRVDNNPACQHDAVVVIQQQHSSKHAYEKIRLQHSSPGDNQACSKIQSLLQQYIVGKIGGQALKNFGRNSHFSAHRPPWPPSNAATTSSLCPCAAVLHPDRF